MTDFLGDEFDVRTRAFAEMDTPTSPSAKHSSLFLSECVMEHFQQFPFVLYFSKREEGIQHCLFWSAFINMACMDFSFFLLPCLA